MSIKLITGNTGVDIQAADDAGLLKSIFGTDDYVLKGFEYQIASNNKIIINEGEASLQGRHVRIAANDSQEVTIDSGSQGENRIDIIAIEYTKEAKENVTLTVVKGTSTSGTPTPPSLITGDIDSGATKHQMALYQVNITGITIESVNALYEQIKKPDPHFEAPVSITLPYTATQDGIVTYFVAPSSNANSYLYIKSSFLNGNDIARTSSTGLGHGTSFPIRKGETISRNTSANGSINMYFTALKTN